MILEWTADYPAPTTAGSSIFKMQSNRCCRAGVSKYFKYTLFYRIFTPTDILQYVQTVNFLVILIMNLKQQY